MFRHRFAVQAIRRRRPRHIEAMSQRTVVQWARLMEPRLPALRWLHSIPNGAHLSPTQAKLLKAEGLTAGVHDLCWPYRVPRRDKTGWWSGLYIEMKSDVGRLSKEQRDFAAFAGEQGFCVRVCRSPDEAIDTLKAYAGGRL